MNEDAFPIPTALRNKAISRARCAPAEVQPLDLDGAAAWHADRLARLAEVAQRYTGVDVSPLGPGWRPVGVAEFVSFDNLSARDAAVAEATVERYDLDRAGVIDAWVRLRGVAFAIEAFSRFCELTWTGASYGGGSVIRLKPAWAGGEPRSSWPMALRLLDLVRSAPEAEYQKAVAAASGLREGDGSGIRSAAAAFLIRERPEWCDAEIARYSAGGNFGRGLAARMLVASVTTPDQARCLGKLVEVWEWRQDLCAEATLITVGGGAAAGFLAHRHEIKRGDNRRKMNLLAQLPGDEAALVLLDDVKHGRPDAQKALLAAGERFPSRTLRVVASATPDAQTDTALRLLVRADPETADALLPELERAARARIEAALAVPDFAGAPVAEADRVPEVLVSAPWLAAPRKPAKPKVIKGLIPPPIRFAWLADERESWLTSAPPSWAQGYAAFEERHWQAFAEQVRAGEPLGCDPAALALLAPEDLVRPLLKSWQPKLSSMWFHRPYLARFEQDAMPLIDTFAKSARTPLLAPVTSPEITDFMYGLLRINALRTQAATWFGRHGDEAVRCLVPNALGPVARNRQKAATILQMIAERRWADPAEVTRRAHGAEAAEEIKALIADNSAQALAPAPTSAPVLPPWSDPLLAGEALPPVFLKDRSAILPSEAVRVLVQLLSISKPGSACPGLAAVRAACEQASLAEFARSLFDAWRQVAFPANAGWVLTAQGILGDDATVELLTPLIRVWPGESAHARAVAGLDVLTAIGSDTALRQLHGLSLKGKFKGLKDRAGERIAAVAEARGLDAEQLADRLIPDFGVPADGVLKLDYGSRQFKVGFSETLDITVRDASGRVLKALPKPGVADDAGLAPAAYARFKALKKESRAVAAEQLWRLELAMCRQRRWTPQEFAELIVAHPLMRNVVRGLVWAAYETAYEQDRMVGSFRVAEDLTYADADDTAYVIPADAHIGLAHPVALGPGVAKWSAIFADYEILQPFAQLGRPIFELTAAERDAPVVERFGGAQASVSRLERLEKHGWRRGAALIDGGTIPHYSRALPGVGFLILPLDPGISAGMPHDSGPQTLSRVWIGAGDSDYLGPSRHDPVPFSRIDPVSFSELIRELTEATAP